MLPNWLKFNPDKASIIGTSGGKSFISLTLYELLNHIRVCVQSVSNQPSDEKKVLQNQIIPLTL